MRDNEFKWDDRKAAANFRKHHVAFDFARSAFDDKKVFERLDTDETDEERFLATVLAGVRMLTICCSQSRSVPSGMPKASAKPSCDRPCCQRIHFARDTRRMTW